MTEAKICAVCGLSLRLGSGTVIETSDKNGELSKREMHPWCVSLEALGLVEKGRSDGVR